MNSITLTFNLLTKNFIATYYLSVQLNKNYVQL